MVLRHMTLALLGKKTERKLPALESLMGPIPGVSDSVSLCWDMRISEKCPSDANAVVGPGRNYE